MEDNTGSRESKKKSMEDNTRSSESKEKRRKSMEDNTRSSESKEKKRKSMEDNTRPTESESEEDILDEGDKEADEEYQVFYCAVVPPSRAPSFFRKARPRKPREMINHHTSTPPPRARIAKAVRFLFRKLTDATTKHHVEPGQNIVLVRPKPLGQRNPKAPMEGDEEIIEEQAICIVCFDILREENILKTECKCGNALIHEKCVADSSGTGGNNNCDYCEQEVQTFPVTLVRGLSSSTPVIEKKAKKKAKNVFGCFHG